MKLKLILFILLQITLFSTDPDFLSDLNIDENNSRSMSTPQITKDKGYDPYSLESEFNQSEISKPIYKSFWQNFDDLIFITNFFNQNVYFHYDVDKKEYAFYKTQFDFVINQIKETLNNTSLHFVADQSSPLLDAQNELFETFQSILKKLEHQKVYNKNDPAYPGDLFPEIRELQWFQSILEKKVYSYNEFLYEDLKDFSLERDEVIHLVIDDIFTQACVLSIGKDECYSEAADNITVKDMQANFDTLKTLFELQDSIEDDKKSILHKTLNFNFNNLLINLRANEVWLNFVTKFKTIAIMQLDRNSPKPSIYSRKELDSPDKEQKWRKRVDAVLKKMDQKEEGL